MLLRIPNHRVCGTPRQPWNPGENRSPRRWAGHQESPALCQVREEGFQAR